MDVIFGGYFPKNVVPGPDGPQIPGVFEICSVSECLSRGPEGWVAHWLHNELGWYDSPELARKVIPAITAAFEVFGYGLATTFYESGRQLPLIVKSSAAPLLETEWASLGFDVVGRSQTSFFECSPLSCNGMASEIPVNRHCLLDHPESALAVADRFSREEPEPGSYYIVQVWRERQRQAPSHLRGSSLDAT